MADVSDEQIARWRDGKAKPNAFALRNLAANAGYSLDWLLGLRSEGERDVELLTQTPDLPPDMILVPRFDVEASAGNGSLTGLEQAIDFVAFQSAWLRSLGVVPSFARLITARGDSMEKTIRDGDLLLIDTSVAEVRDNGIYCIIYGNMLLVKRVHVRINGSIQLISDNPVYPAEDVTASEAASLSVAGRVMWFGRSI